MSATATLDEPEVDQSDSHAGMIHSSIIGILRAIGPIAKSQKNNAQGYQFRGIDQVYNAAHPHFAEQGVYSTSRILDAKHLECKSKDGKPYTHSIVRMRFTFWAGDGSHVSTEVIGEGIDYGGDKASNKAMSTADKYAILQLLKIPTAMIDGDSQSPGVEEQKPATPQPPRKSALELMQEQAAAAEKEAANGNGSAKVVDETAGFATDAQVKRISELEVLLQCGEKINAALAKRKIGSTRSLTSSDAGSIIDRLEIEAAKLPAAEHDSAAAKAAVNVELPPCGPATADQVAGVKQALAEFAQHDARGYEAAMTNLKTWLSQNGKTKLADLDANQAAKLYDSIRQKSLPTFVRADLEKHAAAGSQKN